MDQLPGDANERIETGCDPILIGSRLAGAALTLPSLAPHAKSLYGDNFVHLNRLSIKVCGLILWRRADVDE
jgi:hypothetical protein